MVVLADDSLKLDILQKQHDSQLARHLGQEKTISLVKKDFYWPNIANFIRDDVGSGHQCSKNKSKHQKKS